VIHHLAMVGANISLTAGGVVGSNGRIFDASKDTRRVIPRKLACKPIPSVISSALQFFFSSGCSLNFHMTIWFNW